MSEDYKPRHAAPEPRRMAANSDAVPWGVHAIEHDETYPCLIRPMCKPAVPDPPAPQDVAEPDDVDATTIAARVEASGVITSPRAEDGHKHGTAPHDATTHEREAMEAAARAVGEVYHRTSGDKVSRGFQTGWEAARRYVPPTSEAEERQPCKQVALDAVRAWADDNYCLRAERKDKKWTPLVHGERAGLDAALALASNDAPDNATPPAPNPQWSGVGEF